MGKHSHIPQNKQVDVQQKHHNRTNESDSSYKKLKKQDVDNISLTETPFLPRMDEHAAILSTMQFTAQRDDFILRLHETYGSRYVQRLIESMNVQGKLNVSDPNDMNEQEADKVADTVTRELNSAPRLQEVPEDGELLQGTFNVQGQAPEEEEELLQGKFNVQRQAPEEEEELIQGKFDIQRQIPEEEELIQGKSEVQRQVEEEEEPLQGKFDIQRQTPEEEELQMQPSIDAAITVANDVETRINNTRGNGHPLSDEVLNPMEQAFGADFSEVRTHTDSEADTLNKQLNAKAFTTGQDIFFREGEYSPGSSSGQHLIAHELTHVVQQGAAEVQRDPGEGGVEEGIQDKVLNSIQRNGPNPPEELREQERPSPEEEREEVPQEEPIEKEADLEDQTFEAVEESDKKGADAARLAAQAEGLKEEGEKQKEVGALGRLWNKHWKKGPTEKKVASTIGWLKTLTEGIMQILEWAKKVEISDAVAGITGIGGIIKRGIVLWEKANILEVYENNLKVEKRIKPSGTLGFRTKEKTAAEYALDKVLRAWTWGLVRFIETVVNVFLAFFGDPTSKLVGGIIKGAMLLWQYGGRAIKAIVKEIRGTKGKNREKASEGIYEEARRLGPDSNAWELVEGIMKLKYPDMGYHKGSLGIEDGELVFFPGFDLDKTVGQKEIKQLLYDSMSSKAETSLQGPVVEIGGEIIG